MTALPATGTSSTCTDGITDSVDVARIYCTTNGARGSYNVQLSVLATGGGVLTADFGLTNDLGDEIFANGFEADSP